MAPKASLKGKAHRFDPSEQYRTEIEERTAHGETCQQIAAALSAKGIPITEKTISRRRIEWGLRQRPPHKLAGMKVAKPRPRKPDAQSVGASARRSEIEARTRNGQTAEQIAEVLIAQGWKLDRGVSTVLRLQTFWGLIEPDPDRARGRKKSSASGGRVEKVKTPKSPKVSKREMEREANREQQNSTMHYPSNCFFGPQKRNKDTQFDDSMDITVDSPLESGLGFGNVSMTLPASQQDDPRAPHDVAAEVMSVEILIDLATSTLSAAHNLKDMLLAYQGQRPLQELSSGFPPTLGDLTNARKKVREAAGLMFDLAADPGV